MYTPLKRSVLAVFKAPVEPPQPPAGVHADVRVLRASPRFLTYRMLPLLFGAAMLGLACVVALIAVVATGELVALIAPAAILLVGVPAIVLGYFCLRVDYELRYYVLTDRSIRVREGAWLVEEKTITFANVQNVRVEQGPLQRMLGISDVRVDTAGGGASPEAQTFGRTGHGVALAGIENAAEIRDSILEHLKRRGKGAGLGDLDDERRARSASASSLAAHADVLREIAGAAAALRAAASTRCGPA